MLKGKKYLLPIIFVFCISFFIGKKAYAMTNLSRIQGADRYKTAVEISKSSWDDYSCQVAILATGENFPDALSAAPLAKKLDAPILLTNKEYLTSDTENELIRLGAKTVYIIGGYGVISSDVESKLKSMNMTIIRLGGADRYETSVKIAEQLYNPEKAAVATGEDFSDALSIAPFAASDNMPILLVPKDYMPDCIKNYLKSASIKTTYIVGGNDVISDKVVQSFTNPHRLYGSDKYQRNIAVANNFSPASSMNTIYIATGNNFPDALAGSVVAAKELSPILLVGDVPSDETKNFVNNRKALVKDYKVLGGEGAVSSSTINLLLPVDSIFDKGVIGDSGYINNKLGFSLNWPAEWTEENRFSQVNDNTQELFYVLRYGTYSGKANYNLICVAEDISSSKEIKTAKDYLPYIMNQLEMLDYDLNNNIYSRTFGGKNFDVFDSKVSIYGVEVGQRFYCIVIDGYAITFTASYSNPDELNQLENIMNTIKFTN